MALLMAGLTAGLAAAVAGSAQAQDWPLMTRFGCILKAQHADPAGAFPAVFEMTEIPPRSLARLKERGEVSPSLAAAASIRLDMPVRFHPATGAVDDARFTSAALVVARPVTDMAFAMRSLVYSHHLDVEIIKGEAMRLTVMLRASETVLTFTGSCVEAL